MVTRRIRNDGFVDPCIPTLAAKPPSGPDWVHEIKHDGYRLIVRRDGKAVRLFTRRGHNWTDRYPAIAAVAAKMRAKSFTLDGEAAVSDADGVAVFEALHVGRAVRGFKFQTASRSSKCRLTTPPDRTSSPNLPHSSILARVPPHPTTDLIGISC
jgi:ATP-dependent DNA ligase